MTPVAIYLTMPRSVLAQLADNFHILTQFRHWRPAKREAWRSQFGAEYDGSNHMHKAIWRAARELGK